MDNNSARLRFVSGQYAGAELEIPSYTDVTLGRNPEWAKFVFDNDGVSRQHLVIRYNPNDRRFSVTDYSSSGTYVNNGKRMQTGRAEYLTAGDTLKIGHSDNVVQLVAPPQMSAMDEGATGILSVYNGASGGAGGYTGPYMGSHPDGGIGSKGGFAGNGPLSSNGGNFAGSGRPVGGYMGGSSGGGYMGGSQGGYAGGAPAGGGMSNSPWTTVQEKESEAAGIIGLVLGALACLAVLIMLLCIGRGAFGVYSFASALGVSIPFSWKCWSFVAGYWWVLLIVALAAIAGLVLGIVEMNRTSEKYGSPGGIGVAAVICSSIALLVAVIIFIAYLAGGSAVKSSLDSLGGLGDWSSFL